MIQKRFLQFLLGVAMLLTPDLLRAQTNISGVINAYQKVTFINSTSTKLKVTATTAFSVGDKVLVIQMKGATISTTNTAASYGTVTALNSAGYYEFGTIAGKTTDTLILAGPLCRPYNTNDSVQVVRVPVYTGNVNVTAPLTCTPWPGTGGVGGVLAFEATGTVTLNANIDASGSGFKGGYLKGTVFSCGGTDLYKATASDGQKGEGIAHWVTNQMYGRGRLANGGGGAGSGNTGGGGGGNYGAGGDGGKEYSGYCTAANISYGAVALANTNVERVYMGGGGGGPQQDNPGTTVYNGGNGGGIVIIKANSIVGNNNSILSNGQNVTGLTSDEGGAGGGAGGSIYLVCPTFTSTLKVDVKGGVGSSNYNGQFAADCHGPGGGGGGGVVWFSTAATPTGVTVTATGGAAGTVNNPSSSCYNTTWGAVAGSAGSTLYNYVDPIYNALDLKDTVICTKTSTLTLSVGTGLTDIQWFNGATTPSVTVTGPGVYYVQAKTPLGCTVFDTSRVTVDSLFLGNDTVICPNTTYTIVPKPQGNFVSYQWQNGSPAPNFLVTQGGQYSVTVQTINGCTLRDTIKIAIDTVPALRDTVLCTDTFRVIYSLPAGYQAYLWSTGAIGNTITVTQPGVYTVQMLTAAGCQVFDTAVVTRDAVNLGPDTLLCQTQAPYILLPRPAGNFTSYLWQDGTTTPVYNALKTGLYTLTAQTVAGCSVKDSVRVEIDSIPFLSFVTSDTAICQGLAVQLRASVYGPGLDTIRWNYGDGTPEVLNINPAEHAYDLPGIYTVGVTANYRICPDTSYTRDIEVRPFTTINLGPDTTICPNGEPILLADGVNSVNPAVKYRWSTGDSTASILVRHHGIFWATVSMNGCSTTDSVEVFKNCYLDIPNAFTPNSDGDNDYFLPRQLLSKGATAFHMSIFNRWGQLIFETRKLDGRGWDGKFNGADQPTGVYIYMIEASFLNGAKEKYQGNVTLLR